MKLTERNVDSTLHRVGFNIYLDLHKTAD